MIDDRTHWEYLITRQRNNQLPHALLLAGAPNADIEIFARNFSNFLLCGQKIDSDKACGTCGACLLFQNNTHPDFYCLQPEKNSKIIRIDQVRELITQLTQTAHQGNYKIIVIYPAEAMHVAAVNALLKTLEEPTPNTLIMLLTRQPDVLPATLRSRCQRLNFYSGKTESPEDKNQEQHRHLLNDLKSLSQNTADPVCIAGNWMKESVETVVNILISITMDLIRFKAGASAFVDLPPDKINTLQVLEQVIKAINLFLYLDQLYFLRSGKITHLNQQLLLENLFCTWHEYTQSHTESFR